MEAVLGIIKRMLINKAISNIVNKSQSARTIMNTANTAENFGWR